MFRDFADKREIRNKWYQNGGQREKKCRQRKF